MLRAVPQPHSCHQDRVDMKFCDSRRLQARSHAIIPGGAQTHGAETHALAAAWETLNIYPRSNVVERLYRQGERLRAGINQCIVRHQLAGQFEVLGRPCNLNYATRNKEGRPSQAFRTLFLQELIRGGIIAPSFVVSFSHSDEDIDRTIDVVDQALGIYSRALADGVEKYSLGRPVKPVNRKYNSMVRQ
jgi:glutamate-1-semialdehyde 2,1-aminomutase